jgi:hypothetical protein
MKLEWAVLAGAALIAASILFVGRFEISAVGYGSGPGEGATSQEAVYRLDRWTGQIAYCSLDGYGLSTDDLFKKMTTEGVRTVACKWPGRR